MRIFTRRGTNSGTTPPRASAATSSLLLSLRETIHVLRASSAIFNVMQGALRHSQLRVTHWLQAVRLIMRKWLEHDPTELVVQHLSAWAEKCFR